MTPPAPLSLPRRLLLVAGFALLVMLRLPRIWLHGRFQDEEGTIFFAYGWHFPADALWRPFAGYLNLGANGTTLAAAELVRHGVLSLERAPYLTMAVALAVQTLPALLLATGRAAWLVDRRCLVAALLLVAIPPLTEEVWVNTLHIQFHLALACGVILGLEVPRRRIAQALYAVPLVLAPLCGPGAIVLLPLFALRTLVDRSAGRAIQCGALAAGAAVQLLFFYSQTASRPHHLDPATLAAVLFGRLVALPLLTPPFATMVANAVFASWRDGTAIWWAAAAAAVVYFGWLLSSALRDRRDGAVWLLAAGLAIAAASFGFGMLASAPGEWFGVGAAERYDFLPLVLIGLGVLAIAARPASPHRRIFVRLVALQLISGVIGLIAPLVQFRQGPSWPVEVAAWRRDHTYPLKGWPEDWTVDLSDRNRPCPPAGASAAEHDPSYCETAWRWRVDPAHWAR